jgi:hypothetical protein
MEVHHSQQPAPPAVAAASTPEERFAALVHAGDANGVSAALAKDPFLALCGFDGLLPIQLAAREGHEDVLQALVSAGADAMAKDASQGLNALSWAARSNQTAALRWLLLHCRVDLDEGDKFMLTPLHHAVLGNSEACGRGLLPACASKTLKDRNHWGATDLARSLHIKGQCEKEIVKLLRSWGPDTSPTPDGATSSAMALL